MINRSRILECFQGLVGFRDSAQAGSCYDELTASLKQSDSGIYVNSLPLVTLEMINDMISKDEISVNDYLANAYNDSVLEMLNQFLIIHKKENFAKSLLKNTNMGVFAESNKRTVAKANRFVGWMIIPGSSNSISTQVLQFGGMFSQTQEVLPIYFYSSKQDQPIAVFYTSINKINSHEWFTLNDSGSGSEAVTGNALQFICDYINKDNGHNQKYYIGYYEVDLDGNAIQTQLPCGTCVDYNVINHINKHCYIAPIEVDAGATYISTRELFDIENVGITTETFGLDMKVNIVCDLTEVICDNHTLFATALQKKIGAKIMFDAANSAKLNTNTSTKKADFEAQGNKFEAQLEGYVPVSCGKRVPGELETLTIDFSNIDEICLGMRKKSFGALNL